MQFEHVTTVTVDRGWPLTEAQIAALVAPLLPTLPETPQFVIDGRCSGARVGSTATYRLLRELRIEAAAPVAVPFVRSEAAMEVLASLLTVKHQPGPALLVASTSGWPWLVGWCIVTASAGRRPADPVRLRREQGRRNGEGFIELLSSHEDSLHPRPRGQGRGQ